MGFHLYKLGRGSFATKSEGKFVRDGATDLGARAKRELNLDYGALALSKNFAKWPDPSDLSSNSRNNSFQCV